MTTKAGRSLTASRKEEELADISTKTAEVTAWIQDVLKEKLPKDGLREALVDGVILCKLINHVKPGCVKKYHRRPKMMMMKMENIAFFLSACKSRCGIPPALLFAPTDLQDGDVLTSLRKVLNVLVLLKQEAGGGPTAEQAAKELAEKEAAREAALAAEAEEAQQRGETVYETQANEAYDPPPVEEPEIDDVEEQEDDHEQQRALVNAKTQPTATSSANTSDSDTSWYLSGKLSEYVDIQKEVLSEISSVIHSELSIEGKQQLVDILESHLKSLTHRVMHANLNELQAIVHEMGLGNTLTEVPTTKDRQWYIDFILKYGRTTKNQ